ATSKGGERVDLLAHHEGYLVTQNIANNPAGDPRGDSHQYRDAAMTPGSECDLRPCDGEKSEAECVDDEQPSHSGFKQAGPAETDGRRGQACNEIMRIVYPGDRVDIQKQVAQRAAAEAGGHRDDGKAERVETIARGSQSARQGEYEGAGEVQPVDQRCHRWVWPGLVDKRQV